MKKFLFMAFFVMVVGLTPLYGKSWGDDSVANVKAKGVMVGDPDGKFRANDVATRKEVAVAIDRLNKQNDGEVIVIQESSKLNLSLLIGLSVLCLLSGFMCGLLIGKKGSTQPVINVSVPDFPAINPVINVSGNFDGTDVKSSVLKSNLSGKEQVFEFEEEKFRPAAGVFKKSLEKESESFVKADEVRSEENMESIDKDVDKLKNFFKGENNA